MLCVILKLWMHVWWSLWEIKSCFHGSQMYLLLLLRQSSTHAQIAYVSKVKVSLVDLHVQIKGHSSRSVLISSERKGQSCNVISLDAFNYYQQSKFKIIFVITSVFSSHKGEGHFHYHKHTSHHLKSYIYTSNSAYIGFSDEFTYPWISKKTYTYDFTIHYMV